MRKFKYALYNKNNKKQKLRNIGYFVTHLSFISFSIYQLSPHTSATCVEQHFFIDNFKIILETLIIEYKLD